MRAAATPHKYPVSSVRFNSRTFPSFSDLKISHFSLVSERRMTAFLHRERQPVHEDLPSVNDISSSPSSISLNQSINIRLLFIFSDQEVKMEEAMSHTGIHQYIFFFFFYPCFFFFSSSVAFSLTPAWAALASFPLIHPSVECWHFIRGCMLGTS